MNLSHSVFCKQGFLAKKAETNQGSSFWFSEMFQDKSLDKPDFQHFPNCIDHRESWQQHTTIAVSADFTDKCHKRDRQEGNV